MSVELSENLGSTEKNQLIQWARANEEDARREELTLPLSIDYRGTLLSNNTFRLDQQSRFDVSGITWLNLQVQIRNATLVTIYIHWDGYNKAYITPVCVLWAVKWSVTKEWEHHTVYVGDKLVGYEQKGQRMEMRRHLNVIYKQYTPRELTGGADSYRDGFEGSL